MIKLGDIARDRITGFEGIVIATTEWLYGCRRLTLQPQHLADGKMIDTVTFDEPQCILIHEGGAPLEVKTGGPRPEPRRQPDPRR